MKPILFLAVLALHFPAHAKPLRVFILAGQSNMQGHAMTQTMSYMARDPQTAPLLADMSGSDGQPKTCRQTWIRSFSEDREGMATERSGLLTAGFGATPEKIGPEFAFGVHLENKLDQPILLIKTAWGGKNLHTDFRPPGAGPFVFHEDDLERMRKQGKDLAAEKLAKQEATGRYYRLMMSHVKQVLADPQVRLPGYDPSHGCELGGFVWFQGFNDLVDSQFYPNRHEPGGYDEYSRLLAQFIRDVRKDLDAPELPFVIGVIGVGGPAVVEGDSRAALANRHMREAMAAPALLPEFQGSVAKVLTADFWDPLQHAVDTKKGAVRAEIDRMKKNEGRTFARGEEEELFRRMLTERASAEEMHAFEGISNQAYHYLGSAKILSTIGQAFAEAMLTMK
jgi:hypothetical protein